MLFFSDRMYHMSEFFELLANIVTVLGFPISIFLVVKELRGSNQAIKKLSDSIKQVQKLKNDGFIENLHIHNEVKGESNEK